MVFAQPFSHREKTTSPVPSIQNPRTKTFFDWISDLEILIRRDELIGMNRVVQHQSSKEIGKQKRMSKLRDRLSKLVTMRCEIGHCCTLTIEQATANLIIKYIQALKNEMNDGGKKSGGIPLIELRSQFCKPF